MSAIPKQDDGYVYWKFDNDVDSDTCKKIISIAENKWETATTRKSVKNKRKLNGKGTQVIKAGEILEIFTPGGAGLGDYSERDNELIQTDIENELL